MPEHSSSGGSRDRLPLILIRGYGGPDVDDAKNNAYQGFNDGTVYPKKRGDNYIYEGLVLRLLKSADLAYRDATNIVGYHSEVVAEAPADIPVECRKIDTRFFSGDKVVLEPEMCRGLLESDPLRTIWVFRYYDLDDRSFATYGKALVRLIDAVRAVASVNASGPAPKVNIIAHSMGGLIVREAVQVTYPNSDRQAADSINKIVTLGTPHKGISFQVLEKWIGVPGAEELERFNPDSQDDELNPAGWRTFDKHFPLERLLTVVGTNYRTYNISVATALNRLFSVAGEFGPNYNRSDGLVKQSYAQIDGAPRTFVHKCHGGLDSLVTSREAYEIATRFFFGNVKARLRLVRAAIKSGKDLFGKSEFFFGVSIKPRFVDFDLFHQSKDAENCYGPFREKDLSDEGVAFDWAGENRLVWEGWFDTTSNKTNDLVMRADIYLGERDLSGLGFSDNVIYQGQVLVQAVFPMGDEGFKLCYSFDNRLADRRFCGPLGEHMNPVDGGWEFEIKTPGFDATLRIELEVLD